MSNNGDDHSVVNLSTETLSEGVSPATTPPGTCSLSGTDSCSSAVNSNSSSTQNLAVTSNGNTNGFVDSQNCHLEQVEMDESLNSNGNTTVVVTDPNAGSGQNFVVSGASSGFASIRSINRRGQNLSLHMHGNQGGSTGSPGGRSGGMPRNMSPNRYSPPQTTVHPNANVGVTVSGPRGDSPNTTPSAQHVVHVHINPGETFSVRVGDQIQHIQGPATVRMVSNNGPPLPMPMQVPPGHMVQQIVDENGYLTHVILSPQPTNMAAPQMTVGFYGAPNGGTGPPPPQQPMYAPYGQYAPPTAAPPPPPYSAPAGSYHHHPSASIHASGQIPHHGGGGGGQSPGVCGGTPVSTHSATSHTCMNHAHNHMPGTSASHGHPPPPTDDRTSRTKQRLQQKLQKQKMAQAGPGSGGGRGGGEQDHYYMMQHHQPQRPPRGAANHHKDTKSSKRPSTATFSHLQILNGDNRRPDTGTGSSASSHDAANAAPAPTSTAAHTEADDDSLKAVLSTIEIPKVSDIEARSALVRLSAPECKSSNLEIYPAEMKYDLLISEKKDGKYKSVYSGSANEITLKDLKPATDYHLRVRALYDNVKGDLTADPASFKTAPSHPDMPQSPKLSNRNKTSLILKWNASADNGSKVLSYVLEYDQGKGGDFMQLFSGPQRQYKITKLSPSTGYRFRLAAINDIGQSNYSEVVRYFTLGSKPSQPDPPMLSEQFVKALRISWIRRPNDDEFTLKMEDQATGHGFLTVYKGPELSHKIKNLRRNTEYKFRLQANNDEGGSELSETVMYRTLPDVPSPPARLAHKGRIYPHSFKLAWDVPKDSGGAEITKYQVELDEGRGWECVYDGVHTDCVCDGLAPGHQYRARVAAFNDGGASGVPGRSEWSDIATVCTQAVAPAACAAPRLQGKPKATQLHLKWTYPEYDGGASVSEFEVCMTTPDNSCREVYRGHDTDCVVAGLLPGRPYLLQVRAINKAGAGPWSETLEVVSGAGVPDPPKAPSLSCKSAHSANISWEEPVNNGAAITDYRLEWQANCDTLGNGEFVQLYMGPSLCYEVRNLSPASNYKFRVQACNSAGAGPFSSAAALQTPASSPGAVATLRHSATATSVHLSWKAPAAHGAPITGYNVDLVESSKAGSGGAGGQLIPVDGGATTADISDLLPETTYKVRVQAVNAVGVGPFSSAIKVTTRSLPPQPPPLECLSAGPNSLKLKWGDGRNPDLIHYCLEMLKDNGSFYPVYHGTGHQQKLHKLNELRDYEFRICARNEAGEGPYSKTYSFTTTKAPPPAVKGLAVCEVSLDAALVTWPAVRPMASDPITYILQMQQLAPRHSDYRQVYQGSACEFWLRGLTPRAEYQVRVCAVRGTAPSEDPAAPPAGPPLHGAFSPGTSWTSLSPPVPAAASSSASGKSSPAERVGSTGKRLTDQQWAIIILVFFAVVAVAIAWLVQKLVAYHNSPTASPSHYHGEGGGGGDVVNSSGP